VLARTPNDSNYYPGKLMAYLEPSNKYKVLYFDQSKRTVPRTMFYTLTDKGFHTCQLGAMHIQEDKITVNPFDLSFTRMGHVRQVLVKVQPQLDDLHNGACPDNWRYHAFMNNSLKSIRLLAEHNSTGSFNKEEVEFIRDYLARLYKVDWNDCKDATSQRQANFVEDVILPECIVLLTQEMEGIDAAQARKRVMEAEDDQRSKCRWVQEILEARGVFQEQPVDG
jgi:hypothetical protein